MAKNFLIPSQNNDSITLNQQILCTTFGAGITSICTTPLDVMKVRLQAQNKQIEKRPLNWTMLHKSVPTLCDCRKIFSGNYSMRFEHTCVISCPRPSNEFTYKPNTSFLRLLTSNYNLMKTLVRNEGITTLWSGLTPALIMSVPGTMIYFTAYDRLKFQLGYTTPDVKKLYIPALSGTISRAVAVSLVSPIEMMRTRMQSSKISYSQLLSNVKDGVKQRGPIFLFKGLGPSLLRDVPFSAIYWMSYETGKLYYQLVFPSNTPLMVVSFAFGAFSGMAAAFFTCPFDVVKTHRQMDFSTNSSTRKSPSTAKLLAHLYKTKGLQSLFAGLVPRLLKVAPACAIMISSYEVGKSYFQNKK